MKLLKKKNNFLYFLMLSFVVVSTTAMAISKSVPFAPSVFPKIALASKEYPPVPKLKPGVSFPVVSAQGVMAVDMASSVPLYQKNQDASLLPASTTKIITALVALDYYNLDDILTVGKVSVDGQKMGLFMGEEMRVEDLLYGLLVYSANDAAEVLAQNYAGGRGDFVAAMNLKAKALSLDNTNFENPVGLDGVSQATTARDLVRASKVAMSNPDFARMVGTKNLAVKDVSGRSTHYLKNINELVGEVPGVLGVKTGWTQNARENLVSYIERDGHRVMIALLGSQDRFGETRELIDWIFGNYEWEGVKINK